jgi:hypothetical protein
MIDNYNAEEETAELVRVGKLAKPLRLAAMLEKTMQWPLHGKSADCLREMYELLQRCENEMRYAGWDKRVVDNIAKNDMYEDVKRLLEKTNDKTRTNNPLTQRRSKREHHHSYGERL